MIFKIIRLTSMKLNDEQASIYKNIFLKLEDQIFPSHLEWFNNNKNYHFLQNLKFDGSNKKSLNYKKCNFIKLLMLLLKVDLIYYIETIKY